MRIQTTILPSPALSVPDEMYLRCRDRCAFSAADNRIFLQPGASVSFDTFFNALSVRIWKNECSIGVLSFGIAGTGRVLLKFKLHSNGNPCRVLAEAVMDLTEEGVQVPLHFWPDITDGLLYCELAALEATQISESFYETSEPPLREVRLGVVVTHFNRKQYVVPAVRRVTAELLEDPDCRNISLVVVDNSRTLSADECGDKAVLLPNVNVGGSGGFTRGLLYLKDHAFTHCCFMDDDVSCEIESLRRTYSFFSYQRPGNEAALSGTLFYEDRPDIVLERGARFANGGIKSVSRGLNLCGVHELLMSDSDYDRANYGAWCYFAFALASVKHYPYPFFVRGDDIYFSLLNQFSIVTLNGIAAWVEDFALKEGPMTRYLGFRSERVIELLTGELTEKACLKKFRRAFRDCLWSYNYSSALAVCLAMKDVLNGPETFTGDPDGAKFRAALKTLPATEKLTEPMPEDCVFKKPKKEKRLHKFLRTITAQGAWLPLCFFRKKTLFQVKNFTADMGMLFRYRTVYYFNPQTSLGYTARFDREKVREAMAQYRACVRLIHAGFEPAAAAYRAQLPVMTSEAFWRKLFRDAGVC